MPGKFYGLGVGPGDPELITLKAFRILEDVNMLCIPRSLANRDSLALQVVRSLIKKEFICLDLLFPMSRDNSLLEEGWSAAGEMVAEKVRLGNKVAFVTIGDPMFYSTYGYVLRYIRSNYPDLKTETIPGVMAMSACCSLAGIPLVEANETLAVLPAAYGLDNLEVVVNNFDNVVLMKVNRKVEEVAGLIERQGLQGKAMFFSRCGYNDQYVTSDLDELAGRKLDYMSLLLIKKRGFQTNTPRKQGGC